MLVVDFFTFGENAEPPPYLRADGQQCHVLRAAVNVPAAIIGSYVPTTPLLKELRRQGQQRCMERSALLILDSESEDSVKRLTRVFGTCFMLAVLDACP